LDAYEIDVLHSENKRRVHAKGGYKLVNLNAYYNYLLAKVEITLVILTKELKSPNLVILMSFKISKDEFKPQGARQPPNYILDSFNKFSKVLTNELPYFLPHYRNVDHKIKLVLIQPQCPKHPIG
jgi:hypothetical protein